MTLIGVLRHEFRMQLLRPSAWVTMAGLGLLFLTLAVEPAPAGQLRADVAEAAVKLNWLAPMLAGVLLADRLVRDRRLRTAELVEATGAPPGVRLWGRYLGTAAALAVPVALIWLVTLTRFAVVRGQPSAFVVGLLAFVAIQVPALAFVTAFALVCPVLINPVLFRVLFVGYWLWGNLLSPGYLPTLSGTVLSPMGDYARAGLFGGPNPFASTGIGAPAGTGAGTALVSIALLLLLPALVLTGYATARRRPR